MLNEYVVHVQAFLLSSSFAIPALECYSTDARDEGQRPEAGWPSARWCAPMIQKKTPYTGQPAIREHTSFIHASKKDTSNAREDGGEEEDGTHTNKQTLNNTKRKA